MLYRMQEGVFEGANQADFADKKILYTIKEMPEADYQTIRVPDMTAYRYVRYVSPKGGNGNVAEIEFYGEKGKKLTGKNIGTSGAWYNGMTTCDKAFDGNIYTFFDAPEGKGDFAWTGLDLGKSQSINHKASVKYDIAHESKMAVSHPEEHTNYIIGTTMNGK